jgi:hypothetical protein
MIDIKITENEPLNKADWDNLAKLNGNIIQTTFFNEVQKFYHQSPIYFQLFENNELIAGYKVFIYESKRLPKFIRAISSSISFPAEPIILPSLISTRINEIKSEIEKSIKQYCIDKKFTTASYGSYYGQFFEPLCIFEPSSKKEFNIAIIDLQKTEDELWADVHSKHRNVIRKAEKENVIIKAVDSLNEFIKLMESTYESQKNKAPNYEFIKKYYAVLKANNAVSIFIAYHNEIPLIGAFVTKLGNTAYYAFGGSTNNSLGAGNLLQWHIMKQLKSENISFYNLGQVAKEDDESNLKFSKGISSFKRRFGVFEKPGISEKYILRPTANWLWNLLVKVLIKK